MGNLDFEGSRELADAITLGMGAVQAENDRLTHQLAQAVACVVANAKSAAAENDRLKARVAVLAEHLSGVLHEAEWMVQEVSLNSHARAAINGRLTRARTALKDTDHAN